MRKGLLPLLVLSLCLSTACTDGDSEPGGVPSSETAAAQAPATSDPVTTTEVKAAPGGLVVPECDDEEVDVEEMCALGFVLDDGIFYSLDCAAIKNSLVS